MYFGGFYNQNIVTESISRYNETQNLMYWYRLILTEQILIEDLEAIKSKNDIEKLIKSYKKNGLSHVKIFNGQARSMKKNAPDPDLIEHFEKNVNDIKSVFEETKPYRDRDAHH